MLIKMNNEILIKLHRLIEFKIYGINRVLVWKSIKCTFGKNVKMTVNILKTY